MQNGGMDVGDIMSVFDSVKTDFVGGAVGNLIDRLRLGHVTDFIDVRLWHDYHWPSFNVADSAITVGAIALACFIFWMLRKQNDNSSGA